MRFRPSIFNELLEPLNRRRFQEIVARYDGDRYDKTFKSWEHLVAFVFAQFSACESLRGLAMNWNANSQHHYHLACGPLSPSTLSDAGKRRPVAVFAEAFAMIADLLDRQTRREGNKMLRLIDSTPIPLGALCSWVKSNGRFKGLKMHIVYDPDADCPRILDITDANVNDAQIGRTIAIEAGATYVFDKGYCHYGWWSDIGAAGATFVTRPKANMKLALIRKRRLNQTEGDGFTILEDARVSLASKGDSKLPIPLRRITLKRHETGETLTLLTNDMKRSALAIADLYKARWRIELLFRWIKQHLKIRKFLANNDNAIRLQLFAAMIAYALLRIAARTYRINIPVIRLDDLITQCLFDRRCLAAIQRPPTVNPSLRRERTSPNQLAFAYV